MDVTKRVEEEAAKWGLRISHEELVTKIYRSLREEGIEIYILNERYLEIYGHTYQFFKAKSKGCWVVKKF